MKIKICGLTNPADVSLATEHGADLCGFILAPSPRAITWETLVELQHLLPSTVLSVAVMVNPTQDEADRALTIVDRVQLHGDESPEFCQRYGRRAWKAFRIRSAVDLDNVAAYQDFVGAFLLDSYVAGTAGGTGRTFPWEHLQGRRFTRPTFLAGGLTSANVAEASLVDSVHGLDVSSGIEAEPGRKDPHKMQQFFAAARPRQKSAIATKGDVNR